MLGSVFNWKTGTFAAFAASMYATYKDDPNAEEDESLMGWAASKLGTNVNEIGYDYAISQLPFVDEINEATGGFIKEHWGLLTTTAIAASQNMSNGWGKWYVLGAAAMLLYHYHRDTLKKFGNDLSAPAAKEQLSEEELKKHLEKELPEKIKLLKPAAAIHDITSSRGDVHLAQIDQQNIKVLNGQQQLVLPPGVKLAFNRDWASPPNGPRIEKEGQNTLEISEIT